MASLAPAYITPPQDPAYVAVPKAAHAKFRAPRKRAAKPKKEGQPEADGKNLQQREDEARAWAGSHGISVPTSLAQATALYLEEDRDKKKLRIFIALCMVEDACLHMGDRAKRSLLLHLNNGLVRAGVQRACDDHAALMLAFSQRVGVDKDALKPSK